MILFDKLLVDADLVYLSEKDFVDYIAVEKIVVAFVLKEKKHFEQTIGAFDPQMVVELEKLVVV